MVQGDQRSSSLVGVAIADVVGELLTKMGDVVFVLIARSVEVAGVAMGELKMRIGND